MQYAPVMYEFVVLLEARAWSSAANLSEIKNTNECNNWSILYKYASIS